MRCLGGKLYKWGCYFIYTAVTEFIEQYVKKKLKNKNIEKNREFYGIITFTKAKLRKKTCRFICGEDF